MHVLITIGKKIIPVWLFTRSQPFYHRILAWFATQWYRHPSRAMLVVGVTGTNGKSTVVEMTHRVFAAANIPVASVSSLRFRINEKEEPNESGTTMPGRLVLQRFLARAKKAGCRAAIIEVTSEGIAQYRHCGIDFDIAAFTNLTPEHIERHGSFEAYRDAKAKLFKSLAASFRKDAGIKKTIVVNGDDMHAEYFLGFATDQKIIFHLTDADEYRFDLKLPGLFNIANALCAAAIARSQGISKEIIIKAIEEIGSIPGRTEYIQKKPFAVVVDYAHTPDALRKVYETLIIPTKDIRMSLVPPYSKGETLQTSSLNVRGARGVTKEGKLICVFGAAGGGRDKGKRPELGRVASEYCDEIILTNEDPYDENPKEILHQIAQGLTPRFSRYSFVLNRGEAIERALRAAKEGDTVIITGKGAESRIHLENGRKMPWDERGVAQETLDKLKQRR